MRKNILTNDSERDSLILSIRKQIESHIKTLGLSAFNPEFGVHNGDKAMIRLSHREQRDGFIKRESEALRGKANKLLDYFAYGNEVYPELINPKIMPVKADSEFGFLFRLATTLWSVPVSRGYGRRLRFVVIDQSNGKLIGIFALGDPVFNLRVRDNWIGWSVREREKNLVNVMGAYVVGAVPPYSQLLGGKLLTCLVGSDEVANLFYQRYGDKQGIISREVKKARLSLVTITSALGRSSMYNRIKLPGLIELIRLGHTSGWGHFQVPDTTFRDMRRLLAIDGHPYSNGYRFGSGPNWRIRAIRKALEIIGMNGDILRHGIAREIFAMPLAANWKEYLQGKDADCILDRPSVGEITEACLDRWIKPRAMSRPEYKLWSREDIKQLFGFLPNFQ